MQNIYNIWITIIAILLTWLLTSCVTNYRRSDDVPGRRDLELIGQLEAQFDEFDRRIGRIEETADDITSDIDRIRRLFSEYVGQVQRLRSITAEYKSRITEEGNTSP